MDVDAQGVIDSLAASMGQRMGAQVADLEKDNAILRAQLQGALAKIAELRAGGGDDA